jgi:hypothetical protein
MSSFYNSSTSSAGGGSGGGVYQNPEQTAEEEERIAQMEETEKNNFGVLANFHGNCKVVDGELQFIPEEKCAGIIRKGSVPIGFLSYADPEGLEEFIYDRMGSRESLHDVAEKIRNTKIEEYTEYIKYFEAFHNLLSPVPKYETYDDVKPLIFFINELTNYDTNKKSTNISKIKKHIQKIIDAQPRILKYWGHRYFERHPNTQNPEKYTNLEDLLNFNDAYSPNKEKMISNMQGLLKIIDESLLEYNEVYHEKIIVERLSFKTYSDPTHQPLQHFSGRKEGDSDKIFRGVNLIIYENTVLQNALKEYCNSELKFNTIFIIFKSSPEMSLISSPEMNAFCAWLIHNFGDETMYDNFAIISYNFNEIDETDFEMTSEVIYDFIQNIKKCLIKFCEMHEDERGKQQLESQKCLYLTNTCTIFDERKINLTQEELNEYNAYDNTQPRGGGKKTKRRKTKRRKTRKHK